MDRDEVVGVDDLRQRAERLLGWEKGASKSFSFPTLREFIRIKSEKLYYLMGEAIQHGDHLFEEQSMPTVPVQSIENIEKFLRSRGIQRVSIVRLTKKRMYRITAKRRDVLFQAEGASLADAFGAFVDKINIALYDKDFSDETT